MSGRAVILTFLLAVTCFLPLGCGADDGAAVSGTITYAGKPVRQGVINFRPAKGPARGGPIQSDGRYSCRLPAGEYTVVITAPALPPEGWQEGDPPPTGPPAVPIKYSNPKTSGLTAKITTEKEVSLDFTLE